MLFNLCAPLHPDYPDSRVVCHQYMDNTQLYLLMTSQPDCSRKLGQGSTSHGWMVEADQINAESIKAGGPVLVPQGSRFDSQLLMVHH